MKKLAVFAFVCAFFLAIALPAGASTITSIGTGTFAIPDTPSGWWGTTVDSTIDLDSIDTATTPGNPFTQNVYFYTGYDGSGNTIPFTLSDPLVVDGVSGMYMVSGSMVVSTTSAPDTITLSGGTAYIGGLYITLESLTFPDNVSAIPGGTTNVMATFDTSSTPEPCTLGMISGGIGLLGLGTFRRRRKINNT